MQLHDVLVVGGGPAGLATAQAAAARGLDVRLVHADAAFGVPVRTSGASWRPSLERLGVPARLYRPITSLVFAGPRARVTFAFGEDGPCCMDVTATYRWLADEARAAGAALGTSTRFAGLLRADDRAVVARVRSARGEEVVRARYVVDASGHRGAVLAAAGIASPARRIGIGAEYEYENLDRGDGRAALFVGPIAPSGYGWIFPTPNDTVRVGIGVIRPDSLAGPAEMLRRFVDEGGLATFGLRVGRVVERHGGVIPSEGLAGRFVHGRIVAVGDAVGQALPLVGEGIRYCIESGRVAGDAIARAVREPVRARKELLRYEAWWDREHRDAFVRAQAINERISRFPDAAWDAGVRFLGTLPVDAASKLLRMESSRRDLARFVLKSPWAALRFGAAWFGSTDRNR